MTALSLFAALAIPVSAAADDGEVHHHKHRHYKIIDMGTFAGLASNGIPFMGNGSDCGPLVSVGSISYERESLR